MIAPTPRMTLPKPLKPSQSFTAVYDGGTLDETRHFYYRDHSMIEQRVDGTADTDTDVQHVWGLAYVDELIARHDGTDWLFALQDANYRVTAIVDDTGAVQERYRYTAYGQRTALNPDFSEHSDLDAGSFAFRIDHQGLRHDASGLVYNRARMLHARYRLTEEYVGNGLRDSGIHLSCIDLARMYNNHPTAQRLCLEFVCDPDSGPSSPVPLWRSANTPDELPEVLK